MVSFLGGDGRRPVLIAHGGGNSRARLDQSIADGADFIEVDLWARKGAFEARHERRLGPIPLLFEKWYLRTPDRPISLVALLNVLGDSARVLLDLKNGGALPRHLIRDALEAVPEARPPVATSQIWSLLRGLKRDVPAVPICYSVDVPAQLDLLIDLTRRDDRPDGVSCRHSLLTKDVVERLHEAGIAIIAWTVDDVERAAELLHWGVEGITTHRVAEFRRAFGPRR